MCPQPSNHERKRKRQSALQSHLAIKPMTLDNALGEKIPPRRPQRDHRNRPPKSRRRIPQSRQPLFTQLSGTSPPPHLSLILRCNHQQENNHKEQRHHPKDPHHQNRFSRFRLPQYQIRLKPSKKPPALRDGKSSPVPTSGSALPKNTCTNPACSRDPSPSSNPLPYAAMWGRSQIQSSERHAKRSTITSG